VSNGHFFREHRNRDPQKKLGDIKYAAYDPKGMRRVELLMHGHKEKAAAEYEKAKAGEELSFSMSARVPDDVCSCCGNRAKSAAAYCSHLRDHALQYIPEFKKYAYANNEWPTFFDNSVVNRPADRIARYLEYKFSDSDMRKAAAERNPVIFGSEWAEYEGIAVPAEFSSPHEFSRMVEKIATAMEELRGADAAKTAFDRTCGNMSLREDATDSELELMRSVRPGTLFNVLSKYACVLPFNTFVAYATGVSVADAKADPVAIKAGSLLPEVFENMRNGIGEYYNNMFSADDSFMSYADAKYASLCAVTQTSLEPKFGVSSAGVLMRAADSAVKKATIANKPSHDEVDAVLVKASNVNVNDASVLATAYANYQVSAMLDSAANRGGEDAVAIGLLASHNNRIIFR